MFHAKLKFCRLTIIAIFKPKLPPRYLNLTVIQMFKNPFSFDGRIRRTEFGLSFIIYFALSNIPGLILGESLTEPVRVFVTLLMFIPLVWFLWAQGAKRCHDLGNNGWWQIIPFYFFWLLFAEGDPLRNSYGPNPKNPGLAGDVLESETLDGYLRDDSSGNKM
jgi:uncharacterized membrane protein YhaH (DUF805 family)